MQRKGCGDGPAGTFPQRSVTLTKLLRVITPHLCSLLKHEPQTEARPHLFLFFQHLAYAWHVVRIRKKGWSNNTEFKLKSSHIVGSVLTPANLLANPRSSREGLGKREGDRSPRPLLLRKRSVFLLLVQKQYHYRTEPGNRLGRGGGHQRVHAHLKAIHSIHGF